MKVKYYIMAIQLSNEICNLYPNTNSLYMLHKLVVLLPEIYQLIDLNTYKVLYYYIENMKISIKKNEDLSVEIGKTLDVLAERGVKILELHNMYLNLKVYIEDFKKAYEKSKSELYIYEDEKYKNLDIELNNLVNSDIERLLKLIEDNKVDLLSKLSDIDEAEVENRNDISTVGKMFEDGLYGEIDLIKESGLNE